MRYEQTAIYTFDELSDTAKERAREWYRDGDEYAWTDDQHTSLTAFCDRFGVKVSDWNIGPYVYSYVKTDADNGHFRGVKLRDFRPDYMPTGFYADVELWSTFHGEFKLTGDAKHAFEMAIAAWVTSYVEDWEASLQDEAVDDTIRANEYEFYANGEKY